MSRSGCESANAVATPVSVFVAPGPIDVQTAAQMAEAVHKRINGTDVFIGVAAVADYTPEVTYERKVKKSNGPISLSAPGVAQQDDEIDLICELRAQKGEVWFDLDSLKLIRVK